MSSVVLDRAPIAVESTDQNPFVGWTKQCRGVFATDSFGQMVDVGARDAERWCAIGWLRHQQVAPELIRGFNDWLAGRYGYGLSGLNDLRGWRPADFRRAWDEWVATEAPARRR